MSHWLRLLVEGDHMTCIRQWCKYKCVCVCVFMQLVHRHSSSAVIHAEISRFACTEIAISVHVKRTYMPLIRTAKLPLSKIYLASISELYY